MTAMIGNAFMGWHVLGSVLGLILVLVIIGAAVGLIVWAINANKPAPHQHGAPPPGAVPYQPLPPTALPPTTQPPVVPPSIPERLAQLDALRAAGTITESEHAERRAAIIAEI